MQNTLKKVNCIYDLSFIVQLKFVHSLQCSYICMMITGDNPVKYYFSGFIVSYIIIVLNKSETYVKVTMKNSTTTKKVATIMIGFTDECL